MQQEVLTGTEHLSSFASSTDWVVSGVDAHLGSRSVRGWSLSPTLQPSFLFPSPLPRTPGRSCLLGEILWYKAERLKSRFFSSGACLPLVVGL